MVDTARSVADLKTLLADNATGAISEQDLRDFLVSALGIYGSLSCFEETTQQDNPDTGAILTCWDTNGASNGTTPDHTTDGITVDVTGVYEVAFQCSFSGTGSSVVKFRLRIDGVEQSFGCTRKLGTGGDVGSASFLAPGVSITATEVLSVYVEMDGATDDLTVVDAQMSVRMIG